MIFCGGVLQDRVVYADQRRGFIRKMSKESPMVHEVVRGHVTVIPHP